MLEDRMAKSPGLFDVDERLRRLSDIGDQLSTSINAFPPLAPVALRAFGCCDGTT